MSAQTEAYGSEVTAVPFGRSLKISEAVFGAMSEAAIDATISCPSDPQAIVEAASVMINNNISRFMGRSKLLSYLVAQYHNQHPLGTQHAGVSLKMGPYMRPWIDKDKFWSGLCTVSVKCQTANSRGTSK
jgi:hypothetical protein